MTAQVGCATKARPFGRSFPTRRASCVANSWCYNPVLSSKARV